MNSAGHKNINQTIEKNKLSATMQSQEGWAVVKYCLYVYIAYLLCNKGDRSSNRENYKIIL